MKIYKQTTYETCLASCLIMIADLPHNTEVELAIWKKGWKFDQYLLGQLSYIGDKYNKKFHVTIENEKYASQVKQFAGREVEVVSRKIDIRTIKTILEMNKPVIIYVDDFALHKYTHVPHYILATKLNQDNTITIAEPYEGKFIDFSAEAINKGIIQLRNHLWFSPVIIEPVD